MIDRVMDALLSLALASCFGPKGRGSSGTTVEIQMASYTWMNPRLLLLPGSRALYLLSWPLQHAFFMVKRLGQCLPFLVRKGQTSFRTGHRHLQAAVERAVSESQPPHPTLTPPLPSQHRPLGRRLQPSHARCSQENRFRERMFSQKLPKIER